MRSKESSFAVYVTLCLLFESHAHLFDKSNCSRYDDDDVFTSSECESYDKAICFTGTDVITTPCENSFWCKRLCGAQCELAGGAVCFFDRLSRLSHTCEIVNSIILKDEYIPILADLDGSVEMVDNEAVENSENLEGYGLDYNASDDGCGKHAYCTFCDEDCNTGRMQRWVVSQYHHRIITALAAQMAVVDIVNTCAHFGYLHGNTLELLDTHSNKDQISLRSSVSLKNIPSTQIAFGMGFGTLFVLSVVFWKKLANGTSHYTSVD